MPGYVAFRWSSTHIGIRFRILLSVGSPVDVMDLQRDV